MYDHRFKIAIDFEGDMLDVPDEVTVTEVKFLLTNLLMGLMFQVGEDGTSVVPFDPDTLTIDVTPTVEIAGGK